MTRNRTNPKDEVFYCYVLLDPRKPGPFQYGKLKFSHEPFYVGKGLGKRAFSHLKAKALKGKGNLHKKRKIQKIQREGLEVIVHVGNKRFNEAKAHSIEKRLIAIIGRADLGEGPLTNLTDGGEGSANVSESVRLGIAKNVSLYFKGMTEEQRVAFSATVSAAGRKVWASKSKSERESWGRNISIGQESLSDVEKKLWRERQGSGIRKARAEESEETKASRRAKFSAARKADSEWGPNISKGQAAMSPKAKRQMSANMKARWAERKPKKCPHCGVESVNYANMARWHFDRCRSI